MVKSTWILFFLFISTPYAYSQHTPSVFLPETRVICDCDSLNAACYTVGYPAHCITYATADYPDSLVSKELILVWAPLLSPDTLSLIPIYRHRYILNFPETDSGIIDLREGGRISYRAEGINIKPEWVEKGSLETFELNFVYPDGSGFSIDVWQGQFRNVVNRERKR